MVAQKYNPLTGPFTRPVNGKYPSINGKYPAINRKYPAINRKYPAINGKYPAINGKYPAINGKYPAIKGPVDGPSYPLLDLTTAVDGPAGDHTSNHGIQIIRSGRTGKNFPNNSKSHSNYLCFLFQLLDL